MISIGLVKSGIVVVYGCTFGTSVVTWVASGLRNEDSEMEGGTLVV